MINIGVIGCGYWGPNLIRNFSQLPGCSVKIVSDLDQKRLDNMKNQYPQVNTTLDYMEIVKDPKIDAVVIATPVFTHKPFAMSAMEAGKHVFIEKPMTASVNDAMDLVNIAQRKNLRLMVGHTFEYNPAVLAVKKIIDSGELGDLFYINAQRLNLGLFQNDINVLWDLAPHDISIILFLLNKEPQYVTAVGAAHINPKVEDVATLTMVFDDGKIAFIQSSWLDPNKTRKITITGSKKMLMYNDIEPNQKVWIFDKGVQGPEHYETFGEFQYAYRYGDIHIPHINNQEPLKIELSHFIECIKAGKNPISDGESGLRVVRILEAAQQSIENQGKAVFL
jgi:predicted dehydrogenase